MATSDISACEQLESPDYKFSAAILQTTIGQSALFDKMRRHDMHAKAILQIVSRNPDEIDTSFMKQADLIISADTPEQEMLTQIKSIVNKGADKL